MMPIVPQKLRRKSASIAGLLELGFLTLFLLPDFQNYIYYKHGLLGFYAFFVLWLGVFLYAHPTDQSAVVRKILSRRFELLSLVGLLIIVAFNIVRSEKELVYSYSMVIINIIILYCIALVYSAVNPRFLNRIQLVIVAIFTLQTTISIPYFLFHDGARAARLITASGQNTLEYSEALLNGIGPFSTYMGLALLLPILVSRALMSKLGWKTFYMFSFFIFAVVILLSSFAASALMLFVGMLLFVLLSVRAPYRSKRLIFMLPIVCLLLLVTHYLLSEQPAYEFVMQKLETMLENFSNSLNINKSDTTGRTELTQLSIDSIVRSPIIGVGPAWPRGYLNLGEHNSWVDTWAAFGILGLGSVVCFLVLSCIRVYRQRDKIDYVLYRAKQASFVCYLIGGYINPILFSSAVYIILIFFILSDERSVTRKRLPSRSIKRLISNTRIGSV
jgi:O-antigen ligase